MPSDIVFATYDGGGNTAPALGIAKVLLQGGHRVRMLGQPSQRQQIASAGIEFHEYRRAPQWMSVDKPGPRYLAGLFSTLTSRGMGQDLLDLLRDDPATHVVIDCALLGVLDAAGRVDVHHVALVHAFFAWFDGPFYRGLLGRSARLRRLDARKLWRGADSVLVCSDRELDPARTVPGNLAWTGAVVAPAVQAERPDRDRILVSFSTISFPGQVALLQKVLDAVAPLDLDVIVTTGPSVDPAELRVPANTTAHQYLPHSDILPTCTAVIGHGGHATTFRALSFGLPLLILPLNPMADQPMVGEVVAAAGAGLCLSKNSNADTVRHAVVELLASDVHRERAQALGARIRAADGAATAANLLLG
ncbi:glycosyltransferase [Antrihabitans cavernicola]|uniref:Glycosyltransferase family 1 protein n=1 Tax=Antrihabitans cavernicola TaxID=2495913 RepID=A0A5A7SKE0_9NOCA|nr:nucleotide disphospho-sugar-binding domain-containing protein [Spelaeibacter cavernicola]KAA0024671.1 glycosyltransferase family 1 protein [Spelaeibacter cavernicola]